MVSIGCTSSGERPQVPNRTGSTLQIRSRHGSPLTPDQARGPIDPVKEAPPGQRATDSQSPQPPGELLLIGSTRWLLAARLLASCRSCPRLGGDGRCPPGIHHQCLLETRGSDLFARYSMCRSPRRTHLCRCAAQPESAPRQRFRSLRKIEQRTLGPLLRVRLRTGLRHPAPRDESTAQRCDGRVSRARVGTGRTRNGG